MPIHVTDQGWVLETRTTGYALGLNRDGVLTHRYWGARLPRVMDYPPPLDPPFWASFESPAQRTPEEYPAHGGLKFVEPCLKATFADGVRDAFDPRARSFRPRFRRAAMT